VNDKQNPKKNAHVALLRWTKEYFVSPAFLSQGCTHYQDSDRPRVRDGDSVNSHLMRASEGGAGRGEAIRSSRKLPLVLQVRRLHFPYRCADGLAQRTLETDCWLRRDCPWGDQSPCPRSRKVSFHSSLDASADNKEQCTEISERKASQPSLLVTDGHTALNRVSHAAQPVNRLMNP